VNQRVLGSKGAAFMAVGIAIFDAGILSQSVLNTASIFCDGSGRVFPAGVARVNARTQVPWWRFCWRVCFTTAVVLAGNYDAILVYVESMDGLFFGLSALALFGCERGRWLPDKRQRFARRGQSVDYADFLWAAYLGGGGEFVYRYRAMAALVLGVLLAGLPPVFLLEPPRKEKNCHRVTSAQRQELKTKSVRRRRCTGEE